MDKKDNKRKQKDSPEKTNNGPSHNQKSIDGSDLPVNSNISGNTRNTAKNAPGLNQEKNRKSENPLD